MKTKYRIKEYDGGYTIEIYAYEVKGILWWKRKVWSWEPTNYWGGCMNYFPISQPRSKTYTKLDKAIKQVESWRKGCMYYNT